MLQAVLLVLVNDELSHEIVNLRSEVEGNLDELGSHPSEEGSTSLLLEALEAVEVVSQLLNFILSRLSL